MFKSVYLQTDVTCLEIFSNYLVAGVGGFLHVYDLPKNNLVKRKKIFNGQKIYEIKPNSKASKLIVYGGKNISLIPFAAKDVILNKSDDHKILSDWILDAKWIENDTKIATVFMHNKITIWSEDFTVEVSVKCEERCILYSAHICYDKYNQLLVLSGTVFSEILLWKPFYANDNDLSPVLKRLKQHKGVIFSIHCNLENGLICTTSDDRSAVLWRITNIKMLNDISPVNSDMLQINIACQVYGHLSRVFRCLVLQDFFITAGEDSLLILWNFEGRILRKIDTHQGGPIWSLCYNSDMNVIYSGGNDGAISSFKTNPFITKEIISLSNTECPKIVGILKTHSIICLSESGILYHRQKTSTKWEEVAKHGDLQKYSLLQISTCKSLVALAGFEGQIYIYQEVNGILQLRYSYSLKSKTRIFSFHWIDCKTFIVSQRDGGISLFFILEQGIRYVQTFILPAMKERWPTCACAINDHIIIGDRKGNIHNFKVGKQSALNCIKKAHTYLGVTKLYLENHVIISLGRDGVLKRYHLLNGYLECIESNKTKLSWLIALENNNLLSFSGNNFVISDFKFQRILFETYCGGGHRSWDYLKLLEDITILFIKQKVIHCIQLDIEDLKPKDVIEGYHVREINALKALNICDHHVIISGGEDTILRLSVQRSNNLEILECLKVHLSSIRAIHTYLLDRRLEDNIEDYILFTAGGRAQIISWHLQINVDNLIISCTEKYNFYEAQDQADAETRIMDLSTANLNGRLYLFAGCSDGCIKIFLVLNDMSLKFQKSIFHSRHSITKLARFSLTDGELLGSMATDGNLKFWSMSSSEEPEAVSSFKLHQSGITSCSYIVKDQRLIVLSGGDDNCVTLTLFALNKRDNILDISKLNSFEDKGSHCAQITGTYLNENYFITSSIDQRILVSRWTYTEEQIEFQMLGKYDTSIADPQGLEVINSDDNLGLYIFGNGIEHLEVKVGKDLLVEHL